VASLLFSPMDRGRRGRPCSWVLLAGAGRSRGGRWWGLLIRRGRIWRPHEGDAHFWWWMEVGPGRRRRRLRSVWWRRGQCGAVFGLRLATCVPAVVARGRRRFFQCWGLDGRRAAPYNGGGRRPVLLFLGGDGQRWPAAWSRSWLMVASSRAWWPPAPGGKSHEWRRRWSGFSVRLGWRRLAGGSRPSEPTLLGLSAGDGFGLPMPLLRRVRRWSVLVGDLGWPRAHVRTYLVA
jgi:hypothetical protein